MFQPLIKVLISILSIVEINIEKLYKNGKKLPDFEIE